MKGLPDKFKDVNMLGRAIYPSSKANWYVGLLLISKCFRTFCTYLASDILQFLHVVHFLFLIKTVTAIYLVLIQKPFTAGKLITRDQWPKLIRYAFFGTILKLLWLFGLTLCGPLRSILLYEHCDIVIIAGVSALFSGAGGPGKLRGAVLFLLGIIALLLFDNDSQLAAKSTDHPEGQHHHGFSHIFYYIISWAGVSDHKGGVVLLVITMCLQIGFSVASRKLSVEIGGAKRLNALLTFISAMILAPWSLFLRVIQAVTIESWLILFPVICFISATMFVMDFYVDSACSQRLDAGRVARFTSLGLYGAAFLCAFLWTSPYMQSLASAHSVNSILVEEHVLSGGVVFSCSMFLFAVLLLTAPGRTASKGTFVGYSPTGLPLYTFPGENIQKASYSSLLFLGKTLKQILEDANSRKIFYFLCLNLAFTFVELIYGIWTNSLGLISDGFHMLFDCSALIMGLYAAMIARWKPTRMFSYGYKRVEVLSGFMNGLFLVVIAFFVFLEGVSRLYDPPEIITERLLTVSVAGLIVNLIGIFAFHHGHSHSSKPEVSHHHHHSHHAHQNHKHSHSNANMKGVFLHILADTFGSVGVIISSLLIENFNWLIADPICSIFIAVLIFLSVIPLLKESSLILLLRTPSGYEKDIFQVLQKVLSLDGVVSYRDQHFWQQAVNVLVGSIHVQVQMDTNEQKIINQITAYFRDIGFTHFTVQVEKDEYFHHLTGLGSQVGSMLWTSANSHQMNFNDAIITVKAV